MTPETAIQTEKSILCRVHHKQIRAAADLPALSEIFARLKHASIIGGNPAKREADRFSYWAAEPKEVFEFKAGQKDPFGKLHKALNKYRLEESFGNDLDASVTNSADTLSGCRKPP
jgi:hypothetical protein